MALFSLGISTASLFLRYHTEEALAMLPGLGAESVEVFMATFREYMSPFERIFAEAVTSSHANVHSIHTLNQHFEPELFNAGDRTREDAVALFRYALANGRAMGAHYYTFHGISKLKKQFYRIDWPTFGPRVAQLNDICNQYGITLAYENVHWTLYDAPGFFAKLRDYAPQIGATLDIKQAMQAGCDYRDFIRDMGGNLATVHVSDYDESGHLCLPGQGVFDFRQLFAILLDQGFDGAVLIEVYHNNYQTVDQLQNSLQYLQSVRNSVC